MLAGVSWVTKSQFDPLCGPAISALQRWYERAAHSCRSVCVLLLRRLRGRLDHVQNLRLTSLPTPSPLFNPASCVASVQGWPAATANNALARRTLSTRSPVALAVRWSSRSSCSLNPRRGSCLRICHSLSPFLTPRVYHFSAGKGYAITGWPTSSVTLSSRIIIGGR